MHQIKTKIRNFKLIYFLVFFISIADALAGYIQSSYLNEYVSLSNIGLIIAAASLIVLIITLFYHQLVIKISNYRITIVLFILSIISCYLLYTGQSPTIILTAFIIRYVCFMFLATSMDIFLENISDNAHTGAIRTKFLTIINIAWLASPIIMSKIVGVENNYHTIYLVGAVILTIILFVILANKRYLKHSVNYKKHDIKKAFSLMWKRKNILAVFRSSVLLNFFYFVVSIYIPIYLHQQIGLSWQVLGIMFTIMLLPFVLFQIPAGILADKYIGEKEMLISGHFIMALSMGLIFATTTSNVIIWGSLLFLSRIGAALAEAMQETYFYKQVSIRDVDLISLFRRSRSLGWLTAAIVSFVALKFLAMPYLFAIIGIILFINCLSLGKLVDTK
ncbi:MAG: MFS transporter [bacterium]